MSEQNNSQIEGLENYTILSEIGKGGGGTAFKAYQKGLEQEVVIKKIHSWVKKEERRREVDILKNLRHQYLPAVHDYVSTPSGDAYTVMDYIEGTSFGDMLKDGHIFSQDEMIKYGTQLCEAVAYLHTNNVIHGDIKPDNIMLRKSDDNICLIDFNISGVGDDGVAYSNGYSKGYAAPEQEQQFKEIVERKRQNAQNQQVIDCFEDSDKTELLEQNNGSSSQRKPDLIAITKSSDVFSIGASLFYMYTQKRLDTVADITEYLDGSSGFELFLLKALAHNPAERFSDGQEMFNALKNMHKGDARYRRFVRVNNILLVFFSFVLVIGIGLVRKGLLSIEREKETEYETIAESIILAENRDEMEDRFNEAISIFDNKEAAYTNRALWLYKDLQYDETIYFIENEVLVNSGVLQGDCSDLYYILGNCYFQKGEYQEALFDFDNALLHNENDVGVLVDKAITQARIGDVSDAISTIDMAKQLDADSASVDMANGEIMLAKGEIDEAISDFESCISLSQDDYQKMRAYLQIDLGISQKIQTEETIDQRLEVLQSALLNLPLEYRVVVLERLVNADIEGYSLTLDSKYDEEAVTALKEIISLGWGNINTYTNLSVIYQREGDYENASDTLDEMEKKYADNYVVYKRRAFLERDIQALKTYDSTADFTNFETYYKKAVELYTKQNVNNNDSDLEMMKLEQLYQEVIENGWLKK